MSIQTRTLTPTPTTPQVIYDTLKTAVASPTPGWGGAGAPSDPTHNSAAAAAHAVLAPQARPPPTPPPAIRATGAGGPASTKKRTCVHLVFHDPIVAGLGVTVQTTAMPLACHTAPPPLLALRSPHFTRTEPGYCVRVSGMMDSSITVPCVQVVHIGDRAPLRSRFARPCLSVCRWSRGGGR